DATRCLVERGQPCGPSAGVCVPGMVVGCNWDSPPNVSPINPHFVCSEDFVGPSPERCNGKDDNCDGVVTAEEQDPDHDGYIACTGCVTSDLATGLVGCGDCQPQNGAVHPGALEVCNGGDDNCDGRIDNGACSAGLTCCPQLAACEDLTSNFQNC